MNYPLAKFGFLLLLIALAACSTTGDGVKTISISGALEVPLVAESDRYWIDDGPLFIANKNPLITYRVISRRELEFAGTEKLPHEFFESAFSHPDGIVEESFRNSHKTYEFSTQHVDGLDIYIFSKAGEAKAYIMSSSLTFGVEIYAEGPTSKATIEEIINNANLTKGG